MRVVHEPADGSDERVLATDVEVAESALDHARGLRFRASIPEDYAYVMAVGDVNPLPFVDGPTRNIVDMFFVGMSLDVVWLRDDAVVKVKRMHPWRSFGIAKADTVVELPAGGADGVETGDVVRVVDE